MHDKGNEQNVFDRFDFKPSTLDTVNLNLGFTRSWFQTPNSFDAQNATAWSGLVVDNGGLGPNGQIVGPQDQRAESERSISLQPGPAWLVRLPCSPSEGSHGRINYNYYPSANPFADLAPGGLQAETVGQNRRLTNLGLRANVSYTKGIHNIKAGITYEDTFLTEADSLGVVDPTFNAVCLDASGSSDTDPA